jgi:hypothetical protein
MCSPCRPSLATGTAGNASIVTTQIATNVKPGCTSVELTADCWHMAASKGLPHQQISGIAVDPNDPNTIYVSLRQMIVMGADPKETGTQKVMVSHDGGNTFADLTGNLPDADAHRIALRSGQLYVATDVGIFTARAGSTRWQRFGTGLPQVTYRSMQLDPTGRYLVAGAYGRGGWVYDFGPPSPSDQAARAALTARSTAEARAATSKSKVVARPDKPSAADANTKAGPPESSAGLKSELASSHQNAWVKPVAITFAGLAIVALLLANGLGGRWLRRRSGKAS